MANGKETKIEGCPRRTPKSKRSRGLQLHQLPSDLLRTILSRLTQKEAVRMSILSKKWRRLWKCYPKVVFTRATVRSTDATVGHHTTRRIRFIRGVNSVLRQLRSSILQKFVIKFGLRKRHTRHIDRWIHFSAASKSKHLVLDLSPGPKGSRDTDDIYIFPVEIFDASGGSYVKSLHLGFVLLASPSDFCGFKNLKKLSLHNVCVTGELEHMLLQCAVLEWLSLRCCKLVGLSISHELGRLLFLRVQYCKLQKLNIKAPNLTTLEFTDEIIPIVLGESINISEATINFISSSDCFSYVFSDLVKIFSNVQSLSINFKIRTEVQGFVKNPSRLKCLRHVVLKIDIGGFSENVAGILRLAYLLELAPVLEELVLHMRCFQSASCHFEPSEDVLPPSPHKHLKTVLVTGFYGFRGQFELILHILRNATCLERMTIDPVVRNNTFIPSPKLAETDVKRGRRLAMENLWRKGFGKVLRIL
ncbi:hypothetical protein EJB05_40238 [Eragrostis curvula]|uniref:F-box domain-containing protein n=1 Tax=Eragrostis curvula TaxID=38414 RepID=A0A5J9TZ59_9POAL|nr:hypothetical protein EJB05_40238 [Eragrostis curvula]